MFPIGTTHKLQITGNKVEIIVYVPGQEPYVVSPSLKVQEHFKCREAFAILEESLNANSSKSTQNTNAMNPKPIFSGKHLQQQPLSPVQPKHQKP